MIINHNIAAMNTHRQLGANNTSASKNLEKLSSGLKINKAGDDAAGLAISEKMRGQIRGLDMAQKNAQDGISLIQTAEGALNETHDILQRMRELAVQSSNDTNNDADRAELQKEVDQLAQEITRISDNTEFNTKNLLGKNGEAGFSGKFHIGANTGQDISLDIKNMSADSLKVEGVASAAVASTGSIQGINVSGDNGTNYTVNIVQGTGNNVTAGAAIDGNTITVTLGTDGTGVAQDSDLTAVAGFINGLNGVTAAVDAGATAATVAVAGTATLTGGKAEVTAEDAKLKGIDISSQASASAAVKTINDAIETVSAERSKLGATQNRLEHTINNLGTSSENLTAAESRIRDVDMAKEMMSFTKNNILTQAAQAMLAQAQQSSQGVLQLLR
ncbi:flagellin [Sporosarcina sp. D27]|uniref:flagellin N-terminal helical domain-containing protein n=1 Tax=Sporosarcina sp. D27 TaxID=1382305 RepID=UPI000470D1B6|nr:flagellin [Sporosarcina sp. D27]